MLEHSGKVWQALMDATELFACAGEDKDAPKRLRDNSLIDTMILQLQHLKENGISDHNGGNIDIYAMTEVFTIFLTLCQRNSIDLEWQLDNCIEHYEMFFCAADMPPRPENWPKQEPKAFDFRNAAGVAEAKKYLPPEVFDLAVASFDCEKLVTGNDD